MPGAPQHPCHETTPPLSFSTRLRTNTFRALSLTGTLAARVLTGCERSPRSLAQDARGTSPTHRITMPHVAALTHRLWLADQLLRQGADPNARMLSRSGVAHALCEGERRAKTARSSGPGGSSRVQAYRGAVPFFVGSQSADSLMEEHSATALRNAIHGSVFSGT